MSYNQVTAQSLTPSRPAPQAPQRRGMDNAGNTLTSSGYNSSFTFTPASPSGSSYAFPYSGIGGSPNRGPEDPNNSVIRSGTVHMKEDGYGIGNWIFQKKWLVLREQSLSVHKNEVSFTPCHPLVSGSIFCRSMMHGRLWAILRRRHSKASFGFATSPTSSE